VKKRRLVETLDMVEPMRVFLIMYMISVLVFAGVSTGLLRAPFSRSDHFAAISRDGDPNWYHDISFGASPEILDQDLFMNGIGGSIAAAKAADLVFLGPSFVNFAIDPEVLKTNLEIPHGITTYNMAFVGVRGGEFSRRVAERWSFRPKLWVINVDDQISHFFSRSVDQTFGPKAVPISAISRGWVGSTLNVARINLRWREERAFAAALGETWGAGLFRGVKNGAFDLRPFTAYNAEGNTVLKVDRDPNCHAAAETIALAREFLKTFRGPVVFTLVPHSKYCPTQAREIGDALGIEVLIPAETDYTMFDGAGHLDHKAAVRYTTYLTGAIERSRAFKEAFGGR